MIHTDTIAAIATAMGNSGIGIVRISGQEAVAVADRIFKEKGKQETLEGSPSHTIHYGYIYDGDQVVDEVLVMLMRGPRSFTAEDTVEIDCHGGMLVTRRILETVLKAGARLAEPGEFTKRAFLNGRIDLSQAEAVIDVINAKNEYALKSSVGQLRGSVSKRSGNYGKRSCMRSPLLNQPWMIRSIFLWMAMGKDCSSESRKWSRSCPG